MRYRGVMPTDDTKRYQYAEVYSSAATTLHAAFTALERGNLADAEYAFNIAANALANVIGKQVVNYDDAVLNRQDAERAIAWWTTSMASVHGDHADSALLRRLEATR